MMVDSGANGRFRARMEAMLKFRLAAIGAGVLLVGGIWLAWNQAMTWRAERQLLTCWREESALAGWVGQEESVRRQHERTLSLIRRNQAMLVPFLARRLEPPDQRLRETIRRWLDHVPWVTWRPSFAPDWSVMARCCLEELGPEARSVIPVLEAQLHRPKASSNAALALVAIGPETMPCLLRGLESPMPQVRIAVLEALGQCKQSWRAEALPLVLRALDDPDPHVEASAAAVVGTFPETRSRVIGRPTQLLSSSTTDRYFVDGPALGLALLGEDALAPLLERLEATTNGNVFAAVYGGLALADEVGRTNSPWATRGARFDQLRCYMNFKSLTAANYMYSGKQDDATVALLHRLASHPAATVRARAITMLRKRGAG